MSQKIGEEAKQPGIDAQAGDTGTSTTGSGSAPSTGHGQPGDDGAKGGHDLLAAAVTAAVAGAAAGYVGGKLVSGKPKKNGAKGGHD